jgi:hypothetical protein
MGKSSARRTFLICAGVMKEGAAPKIRCVELVCLVSLKGKKERSPLSAKLSFFVTKLSLCLVFYYLVNFFHYSINFGIFKFFSSFLCCLFVFDEFSHIGHIGA